MDFRDPIIKILDIQGRGDVISRVERFKSLGILDGIIHGHRIHPAFHSLPVDIRDVRMRI